MMMPKRFLLRLALAAGFASTLAVPAAAQQVREISAPPGPWSPPGVDVQFPEAAGEYRRGTVRAYGANDWSVSYVRRDANGLAGLVSVYLYVPQGGCAAEFEGAVAALRNGQRDAREVWRSKAPAPGGAPADAADHARFMMKATVGGTPAPVVSDVYVYCPQGSRWAIKYRATWPAANDESSAGQAVLGAIDWAGLRAD